MLHDRVLSKYTIFDDTDLNRLLSLHDVFDCLEHQKFLILEPIHSGEWMLPVLSFRYDFRRSHPDFRLRLALFLFEKIEQKDELRAIGYRFESPEGEGIHHYYHAQGIREFAKNIDRWRIPCPGWLPTKQPAFALDANSPLTLVACILISLYGRGVISKLRQARFWNLFEPHVAGLMSSTSSFQPTYWEVSFGKTKRFYKTWEKKTKFRDIMRNAEKATEIKEISFEEYGHQKDPDKFIY